MNIDRNKLEPCHIRIESFEELTEAAQKKQSSPPAYSRDEEWVREYIKQFGEEPSFF